MSFFFFLMYVNYMYVSLSLAFSLLYFIIFPYSNVIVKIQNLIKGISSEEALNQKDI